METEEVGWEAMSMDRRKEEPTVLSAGELLLEGVSS